MKITFVKFYQGVQVHNTSNQTSSAVVTERTSQNRNLVAITKTNEGVWITTTEHNGKKSHTEIPYNNVAYINYEPTSVDDEAVKPANETQVTKKTK